MDCPTPTSPASSPENQADLVTDVAEFFEQRLAGIKGFQNRDSQHAMAVAVAETIKSGGQLAVEAGTGTGKSLAYLVPLLLAESTDNAPSIISTKTVQLQDQLLKNDLPILQELLKTPRKVVQAKGWANYVCVRKVESPEERTVRELGPTLTSLRKMLINRSGKLTRQEAPVSREQWAKIKADPLDCQKRHCPHFGTCGLFAERRELETAEIIITNHAFLLTDLRLRREGRGLLPQGEILVIDEAHRLDDVATDHLAVRFDPDRIFSSITSPLLSGADGWLAATRFTFLMSLPAEDFQTWSARFDQVVFGNLKSLEAAASSLFFEIQGLLFAELSARSELRELLHSEPGEHLANLCSEMCLALEESANTLAVLCRDYEESFHLAPSPELLRLSQSLAKLGLDLQFLIQCDSQDWVYLLEADSQALVARPVDNAQALESELFSEYKAVVVTSASLRVNNSFEFFKRRSGFSSTLRELAFPSPFEVARQTFMGFISGGTEPGAKEYVDDLLPDLLDLTVGLRGRTFLLTTSHRRVKEFAEALRPQLAMVGIEVLAQGQEPPGQLIKRFCSGGDYVLIGVDTFWEGVDIPGERLSCVVMTRLPFPVPTDILFQARSKRIESEGGNSFRDLSMPLVALKLKQGFGRLLRNEEDKGIFLLTDPRVNTKRYGKKLAQNIPCSHASYGDSRTLVQQALNWFEEQLPDKKVSTDTLAE